MEDPDGVADVRFEVRTGDRVTGIAGVSPAGGEHARLLAPRILGADHARESTRLLVAAAFEHAVTHYGSTSLVVVADEGHRAVPDYLAMGFAVQERMLRAYAP